MICVVHIKIRQMQNDYEACIFLFFSELFSNIPPNIDHYQRIKCIPALLFDSRSPKKNLFKHDQGKFPHHMIPFKKEKFAATDLMKYI